MNKKKTTENNKKTTTTKLHFVCQISFYFLLVSYDSSSFIELNKKQHIPQGVLNIPKTSKTFFTHLLKKEKKRKNETIKH